MQGERGRESVRFGRTCAGDAAQMTMECITGYLPLTIAPRWTLSGNVYTNVRIISFSFFLPLDIFLREPLTTESCTVALRLNPRKATVVRRACDSWVPGVYNLRRDLRQSAHSSIYSSDHW